MRTDDAKSATHFDEIAKEYAGYYSTASTSGHSFRYRRSKCCALLGAGPLGDLLDVGGASGVYFEALKSQVTTYHIVDISPLMVKLAEQIPNDGVPLFCHLASAYKLPFPDGHFQTVVAMGLLEYLDEPWKALAELARVTKPGGVLVVSYPNAHSPMRRMSELIYRCFRRPAPFASHMFSVEECRAGAAPLALKEVCINGYNATLVPFPLTWKLGRLAYWQAAACEPFLGPCGNLWGTSFTVKYEKIARPTATGRAPAGSLKATA